MSPRRPSGPRSSTRLSWGGSAGTASGGPNGHGGVKNLTCLSVMVALTRCTPAARRRSASKFRRRFSPVPPPLPACVQRPRASPRTLQACETRGKRMFARSALCAWLGRPLRCDDHLERSGRCKAPAPPRPWLSCPAHEGASRYGLNLACPVFPAAVFRVIVIAAPATGFFASPLSAFSPAGARVTISRSEPRTTSAEAVKPWVATGL
jgi:hypothetical protein